MYTVSTLRLCASALAIVAVTLGAPLALSHEHRDPRRIEIELTESGFQPSRIPVLQHEQVTLVFTRRTDRTCAKEISLQIDRRDPNKRVKIKLDLNKPSTLTLRFSIRGKHVFACSDGAKSGAVVVVD
jgi:plastocyanin domain-containing protein